MSSQEREVDMATQAAVRARRLGALHRGPGVLVLPNAWDLASAVLIAGVPGVRAIATTSAGVAAAGGRPDGEEIALADLLAVVRQVAGAVDVPVSVDLEAGYGAEPADVARSVAAVIEAGAVGVNLEDGEVTGPGLDDPGRHAEKIAAAREAADRAGVPLVINARTDTYWRDTNDDRFAGTVARLRRYLAAGADCLFVPGYPDPRQPPDTQRAHIADLVAAVDGAPVNLLSRTGLPTVAELADLGIRRLSVGSGLYRLALAAARNALRDLLDRGDPAALATADELPYAELAKLLRGKLLT
jgi:2-methylisocitrate lyase-like PEP mutase family enzyme